jgi:hypothetical protein
MLIALLSFLKDIFKSQTIHDQLEAHIVAGNPQNAADVEMLERGFYNRYQQQSMWHFRE